MAGRTATGGRFGNRKRSRGGRGSTSCRTTTVTCTFPMRASSTEDRDGCRRHEDIEVVTPHYRGAHAGAAGLEALQAAVERLEGGKTFDPKYRCLGQTFKNLSRSHRTELRSQRRPRQGIRYKSLTACGMESWLAIRSSLTIQASEGWDRYGDLRKVGTFHSRESLRRRRIDRGHCPSVLAGTDRSSRQALLLIHRGPGRAADDRPEAA